MTTWRMGFTALADLSASMFAACFMALLIFLGAAQQRAGVLRLSTIDADPQAILIVERSIPQSADALELLRTHGQGPDIGIDLFADRMVVAHTAHRPVTVNAGQLHELAPLLEDRRTVRLYVFSNGLYNDVATMIGNGAVRELTIPYALRDSTRPESAWNEAFLRLVDAGLEPAVFRRELAVLLGGGPRPRKTEATKSGENPAPRPERSSLTARFLAALALSAYLAGLMAIVAIERRRFLFGL